MFLFSLQYGEAESFYFAKFDKAGARVREKNRSACSSCLGLFQSSSNSSRGARNILTRRQRAVIAALEICMQMSLVAVLNFCSLDIRCETFEVFSR